MKSIPFWLVRSLFAAALVTAVLPPAQAKPFRFARAADMSTWDIHAQNVGVNNTMHAAVYDTLVEYDPKTFKPQPSLATEWKLMSPTQLRLTLRQGVKFSDGSDFTAADAKFSLERAKAKTSNFAVYALGIDLQPAQPSAGQPADRAAHHEQTLGR